MKKTAKRLLVVILFAAIIAGPAREASADTADTAVQIAWISAAVVGGVLLIGIIGASLVRDDPRFMSAVQDPKNDPLAKNDASMKFGVNCPDTPTGALTVCW